MIYILFLMIIASSQGESRGIRDALLQGSASGEPLGSVKARTLFMREGSKTKVLHTEEKRGKMYIKFDMHVGRGGFFACMHCFLESPVYALDGGVIRAYRELGLLCAPDLAL